MIEKIGHALRPLVKKKQEEEAKQQAKKDKQEKKQNHESESDGRTNSERAVSNEMAQEIDKYLHCINNHEYYKLKGLNFKIDDESTPINPKIIVKNTYEDKVIQKIGATQLKKIYMTIQSKEMAMKSGALINIKC